MPAKILSLAETDPRKLSFGANLTIAAEDFLTEEWRGRLVDELAELALSTFHAIEGQPRTLAKYRETGMLVRVRFDPLGSVPELAPKSAPEEKTPAPRT